MRALVVGAGPAGSLAAINISEKAEVTLVEAKGSSGFPVKCGGLISEDCFEGLEKYCRAKKAMQNRIRGAFFFSPSGRYAELTGRSRAVVVERKVLDALLLREASKRAEVRMKTRFEGVHEKKVRITEAGVTRFEEYDFIIGADGAESSVAKTFNFERPAIFTAKQYLMEFETLDSHMVELYFGRRYSDGFFAYASPVDDGLARVGVVSRSNPSRYLERLLSEHPSASQRAGKSVLEVNSGPVPIGLVDFVNGNAALIGDSAGMVKPYTGGGLYYLLRASEVLGEWFPNLNGFRTAYMREFGREYRAGERIRRMYDVLDDGEYDFLVDLAKNLDFSQVHMDSPSTALRLIPELVRLIRKPGLALKVAKILL